MMATSSRVRPPLVELNANQRTAVRHIDGPLLVVAGAGSGKTRVITHKIAYLVRDCGVAAGHVAAVTFTNKAAREMKARLGRLLSAREMRGLRVSTFHSLGLDIIRAELRRLGYKPGFSIFDAQDSRTLLSELARHHLEDAQAAQVQDAQWRISRWKNGLEEPPGVETVGHDPAQLAAARLYALYQRHLKAYNALDFDDLIGVPVRLLRSDAEARESWQNAIRYLLVDEYQDTNAAQCELMRHLVGVRAAFTVVGDDDQSVYGWRGARPENLAILRRDYPRLTVIMLEQNYRSTGRILRAANALIGHNGHLFEKRLWSELGAGEPLRVLRARDPEHEAQRVVSEILHHRFKHRLAFQDYAILYRGNHQSRPFERALREHRIPYQLAGGSSFFDKAEVKDVIGYMRLLANPDDDNAFLRVVNTPRREIGPATLEKLAGYATRRGVSLFAAVSELGLEQQLPAAALGRLRQFTGWLKDLAQRATGESPAAIVTEMVDTVGYREWLHATGTDGATARRRIDNVGELLEWVARVAAADEQGGSLGDVGARLALMGILEREGAEEGAEAVRLMTLHAAKGLEFPHVYLVGMEEELLPHRTSLEDGSLEEERRLAYVGITRARHSVTFCLAAQRSRHGAKVDCVPSRFLAELPQQDVEWEGLLPDAQQRKERGQAHLAHLRGRLLSQAGGGNE